MAGHTCGGGGHERKVGVMEKPGRDTREGKQREREKSYS